MRQVLLTLLIAIAGVIGAWAQEVPQLINVMNRQTISLNGDWHYIVDVQEEGYYDYRMNPTRWGFFNNAKPQRPEDLIEYDFDAAPTMKVPGDWNTQDGQLFFYEGTVWFHRYFDYQPQGNRRALLYFGAVNYECHVYVNGKKAGHHEGGFTPFNLDVTDLLHQGRNFVVVKVDNKRKASAVPTQIFDWWNYGGITRDVLLVSVAPTYIENYTLQLNKTVKGKKRFLDFSLQLNHKEAGREVTLTIPKLKLKQKLITDASGCIHTQLSINKSKLSLWSPANPKLYRVEIEMGSETISDEIGFRTIETRGKQILLNGEPIFLKGICLHEEKPNGGGRANSSEDAHTLLTWAEELGCNFVRLAHYPHNENMVREAERMGILVWSEIPCYWTIDWKNQATYQNAQQQLTDMIQRDHNRANVIIWSIANETPHSAERDAFLGRLARYARSQDSTRLISMAMEVTGASDYVNRLHDNMNQYVDVVSFNQYVGWYRDVNDAPKMKWEIPYEKPVIVSEFGGGAKYGLHGAKNQRWTEEFQENLYRENLAMLEKIDGLAGTTPWILKDFRSPRRVLTGIQDYYNMKGLVSDKGERKKAWYILKEWYASNRSSNVNDKNLFASLLDKSQTEVDARIDSLWAHFFTPGDLSRYEADGEKTVYYEVGDSMAFILDTGSNDVRTEGMSYGMMISVQLNKRTEFDKLWRWAKTYMAYPKDGPWDGYFCWQCGLDGTQIGTSNASDGEIYFVTALFLAAEKWGEPRYADEANEILRKVSSKDGPKTGVYNLFDDSTRLVTFVPNEDVHWYSDPSYCLPAFLDLWAVKADANNDFWREAADKARWLLNASQDSVTGLFPDYCLFDGNPYRRPQFAYNTDRYQYDAIRCAMNVGMDYYLTGKAKDNQRVMMRRLLQFFKNDGFQHGQFNLDGSEPTDGYTEGMAGANAVGAFALADSENAEDLTLAREYVQRLWDVQPPTGKWRYYVGMVYFLSILHVSGHFSMQLSK